MKAKRRYRLSVIALFLIFPLATRAGNLVIRSTTTLSAETAKNTSAAGNFATQANGNLGAGNISKQDIHSLLYPAARTKVFAHLMLWFGQADHMNVGYSSTDPAQVKRQIADMISRGIDGVVMVWYGPDNAIDQAAKLVMQEAEAHPGFSFAISIDNGAIRWNSCTGCDPQHALISHLQYIEQTYFPSPAYLRVGGRPVVSNFDIDLYYKVDWSAAKAAMATDPVFLFQNGSGFSHVQSGGAFSWDAATSADYGMTYLTNFYQTGMAAPGQQTWGASYKGFNDTLASWGLNRVMGQQCGQTWLQTFSKINSLYNSTNQLSGLQLVTWNDYEEGTEIESGIDNCVSVSAAVASDSLQWKVTGSEDTIDHYTVYVSSDGRNLMHLADAATGSHALDMCGYSLSPGNYEMFVQAVGKPNLNNQMSAAVSYAPSCTVPAAAPTPPGGSAGVPTPPPSGPPATPPPVTAPPVTPAIALSASPSSVIIGDGQLGGPQITITAQSGSRSPISLSCTDLPAAMSCAFSPAVVTPGSKAATSVLKVSVTRAGGSPERHPKTPRKGVLLGLSMSVAGLFVLGQLDRKRILRAMVLSGLVASILLFSSCGMSAPAAASAAIVPGSYTIRINAASATGRTSLPASITIR
ncbi:MAG: endo-1,3-alpha-glucanase family glycosylhydrolase [Terriglobales bacterium]